MRQIRVEVFFSEDELENIDIPHFQILIGVLSRTVKMACLEINSDT